MRILDQRVKELKDEVEFRNQYMKAKAERENAYTDLEAINGSPNYTPLLNWKIAKVYMDMERNWEAFWRFRYMADRYPDHEFAEDILFNAFSLAYQLDQEDVSIELSERYFAEEDYAKFRGTIADKITDLYTEIEQYDEIYRISEWYLQRETDDAAAKKLPFKHGMARMLRYENNELVADFKHLAKRMETLDQELSSVTFGLAYLFENEHQLALDMFYLVLQDRSDTRFTADASFRIALAKLGLDEVVTARDLIIEFISKYPDNSLRASAELTLGNIIELLGDSDTALEHYKLVERYTEDRGLEAEAEVKISRILVYQDKSEEAIARLSAFIELYRQYPESIPVASAPPASMRMVSTTRGIGSHQGVSRPVLESTDVSDLDPLLVEFIEKDRALRESRAETAVFFDTVSTDAVLLEDLIRDRAKQYRYFKANPNIERIVKDSFLKDDDFRASLEDTRYAHQLRNQIRIIRMPSPSAY